MSAGRANLNNQGRGLDAEFFRGGEHIFDYEGFNTTANHVVEYFDIDTVTVNPAYGSEIKFELDNRGDLLGGIDLCITRTAISGGSNPYFDDYEGYSSMDYVRFFYGNKMVWEAYGDELYREMKQHWTPARRTGEARLQFGEMSIPDRITNAASTKTWKADLQVPWEALKKHIPMCVLPNVLQVTVGMKPFSKCTADGSSSTAPTISKAALRCEYIHIPDAIKEDLRNHFLSGNGLALKVWSKQFHRGVSITANSGQQRIPLRNITGSAYSMDIVQRVKTQLDTANTVDNWSWQLPSRFWIEDSGARVTPIIECTGGMTSSTGVPYYDQYELNVRAHPTGVVGLAVGKLTFCLPEFVEASRDDCYGSRTFQGYNNPELVLDYDNAPSASYVDVWFEIHNKFILQRGDFRKAIQN